MAAPASPTPGDELPIDVALIKVLASDSRRDILRLLGERRRTLTELSDALNLKKATVLEHLKKLVESGLIRRLDEDERLWIYYELTPQGLRLVRPQRTRFYLVLAGSAAAVVLVGAIVAAALLWNAGDTPASPDMVSRDGDRTLLSDARGASAPLVAWRGIDETVHLSFADVTTADGSLVIGPRDAPLRTVPSSGGAASLDGAAIDALPPGSHALSLRTSAGDLPLPAPLVVRDPPVAIEPLVVTEGDASQLRVHAGDPGLAAATVTSVSLDGAAIPVEGSVFTFPAHAAGNATLQVGRLATVDVRVVPDFAIAATRENATAQLVVTDRDAPLANATVLLDGDELGTSDANGTLTTAWPSAGGHALRIVAPDGRARELGVVASDRRFSLATPSLLLDALHAGGPAVLSAHVGVTNRGVAEETVTLVARLKGVPVASTLVVVPANGAQTANLRADVALDHEVEITAHAARASLPAWQPDSYYALDDGSNASPRSSDSPAPAGAPAAPSPWIAAFRAGPVADAQVTLPALAADPGLVATELPEAAAKTPAPPAVAILALVALAALAYGRRRR